MATQQALLEQLKWMGQRAKHVPDLTLESVVDHLPLFERRDLPHNEYLDLIERHPFGTDSRTIPVGTVSKRYFLVQHCELVQRITIGLDSVGIKAAEVPAELWISDYGERVRIRFYCPQRPFDPGDQFPLVLSAECFNSVDKTCALEIRMSWLRLVCMNGLAIETDASLRKIHDLVWMKREDPGDFVKEQLGRADVHFKMIRDWIKKKIDLDSIATWVQNVVAKSWTMEAAARVYHICSTGFDGAIAPARAGTPAYARPVSSDKAVPGASAPVRNLYHAAQALSWVAARRPAIQDQIEWSREIPQLIEKLSDLG